MILRLTERVTYWQKALWDEGDTLVNITPGLVEDGYLREKLGHYRVDQMLRLGVLVKNNEQTTEDKSPKGD